MVGGAAFGTYLAGNFAFELDSVFLVDETEIAEDLDTLLVIGEKLKVLVGHELFQLDNVLLDYPFVMLHFELFIGKDISNANRVQRSMTIR